MEFNMIQFFLDNLGASGVIGSYVTISILGITLFTYVSKNQLKHSVEILPKKLHPLLGGLLGIIPGCGATIVVSSLYKKNKVSFGGLFAAFIATLGEGSFVLLGASSEADVAMNLNAFLIVNAVGLVLGVTLGYVVDIFGFRSKRAPENVQISLKSSQQSRSMHPVIDHVVETYGFYTILALAMALTPSALAALWGGSIAFLDPLIETLYVIFAILSMLYFIIFKFLYRGSCCNQDATDVKSSIVTAVYDIALVIFYVFISLFMINFLIDYIIGPESFDAWLMTGSIFIVFIAAFIGALPGCGGMIAVAAAFVSIPSFPIAALIAAGIATSGDGIFPLFASNKKDAIFITLMGFVVAIVVGYMVLVIV